MGKKPYKTLKTRTEKFYGRDPGVVACELKPGRTWAKVAGIISMEVAEKVHDRTVIRWYNDWLKSGGNSADTISE